MDSLNRPTREIVNQIEDYALIGDCQTAALCGDDGSIDWLCWPRFDSGACFASLIGMPENGRWKIAPLDEVKGVTRHYRDKTLILETQFRTPTGVVQIVDFMPIRRKHSRIIRLVRGLQGQVRMGMELVIRFNYGQSVPWVTRVEDGTMRAIAGPDMVTLRTPVQVRGENLKTISEFMVSEGEVVPFVLAYGTSYLPLPKIVDENQLLKETESFWQEWAGRCTYDGPHVDAVIRSLITLKALTYMPTGGMVAAPTTSLPEQPQGTRNWDYRYCWLRDATFTLLAFMHAGYYQEAADWQNWLLRAIAGSAEQVQIMYGVAGERHLPEWEVPWLTGYHGASPVRVGNAAAAQLQLDIYGELADALHQAREGGLPRNEPAIELQRTLLQHLEQAWRKPDEGIWEVRGPERHFTHSKVMAWLAFDRTIRSSEKFGLDGPTDRWRAIRQQIHDEVCEKGFDRELGSFVQSYGSKIVDANLLLLPLIGFLPPTDPRIIGTIQKIERDLLRDGFVERYDTGRAKDGLPPGEGVFLACSFWLADNYILLGREEDARKIFEKLLSLRNDVGLLAEEFYPETNRLMGNFPQAFSHVALVNTALNLHRENSPADQRAKPGNSNTS